MKVVGRTIMVRFRFNERCKKLVSGSGIFTCVFNYCLCARLTSLFSRNIVTEMPPSCDLNASVGRNGTRARARESTMVMKFFIFAFIFV